METLGIDIGGTAIKAAIINTKNGTLVREHIRVATPKPPTSLAVWNTVSELIKDFTWRGKVGIGFPGVIKDNKVLTAANLAPDLPDSNPSEIICRLTSIECLRLINDADAAALAELRYGAAKEAKGTIMVLTLGTGVGTAIIRNKQLIPNLELGHIVLDHCIAEDQVSEIARIRNNWSWETWSHNFNRYLNYLENLFWPDLFLLGGGGVYQADHFMPLLKTRTPVRIAKHKNMAGIIGAASLFEE